MKKIKCASIFSGIGGFELGLSWSIPNLEVIWQVELDDFCRDVLNKHFPESQKYVDVRTFDTKNNIDMDIQLLCAGFPCTDISQANHKRNGLNGKKSGLFWELYRVISNFREAGRKIPIILLENVTAITFPENGMSEVLSSLSEIGYCIEWFSLRASDFGLPHKRERIFWCCYAPYTYSTSIKGDRSSIRVQKKNTKPNKYFPKIRKKPKKEENIEPTICRENNGVSSRLHKNRLKALGNAITPQCTEWIGYKLLSTGLISDVLGDEYTL